MKLIADSTKAFYEESRKATNPSFFEFLHGYFYARFPYLYIGVGTGQHWIAKAAIPIINGIARMKQTLFPNAKAQPETDRITFADTYHGKVVPLSAAKQLVSIQEDIHLENLEKVIPYKLAKDLILQESTHLAVLDCPCRASRENPCLPLDVCLIVGEPFVNFMHEHLPEKSRSITQLEALTILEEEDQRGHVHHAFFKEAMLGRFYAICNCCSCCCGAIQAHQHGTPMLASSGYVAEVDEDECIGCSVCVESCQFDALSVVDGVNNVEINKCMGCGICITKCELSAISLRREPSKGIPLELDQLMSAAASS